MPSFMAADLMCRWPVSYSPFARSIADSSIKFRFRDDHLKVDKYTDSAVPSVGLVVTF